MRKCVSTIRGGERQNSRGLPSAQITNDQLLTGLVMNPADSTSPTRFGGRVAASFAANGVEKDSATSRNGLLGSSSLT